MRTARPVLPRIIVVGLLSLTGCVSFTEPVQTGEDTYMITANARGGFSSNGELEGQTIQKAKDFCAIKGMKASLQNAGASGVQGWTPQNTQVVFKCLPSCEELFADPALDPIRTKVALGGVKDQTVIMRVDNSKPTMAEKAAIALWDQKRQECQIGEPSGMARRSAPVAGAILVNSREDMEQLIAALYSGQITYGQFAAGRSGLFEQATAGTAQALQTTNTQNLQARIANQAALSQAAANASPPPTVQIISPNGAAIISPTPPGAPTGALAGYQYAQDRQLRNQLLEQQIENQKAINQQLTSP